MTLSKISFKTRSQEWFVFGQGFLIVVSYKKSFSSSPAGLQAGPISLYTWGDPMNSLPSSPSRPKHFSLHTPIAHLLLPELCHPDKGDETPQTQRGHESAPLRITTGYETAVRSLYRTGLPKSPPSASSRGIHPL